MPLNKYGIFSLLLTEKQKQQMIIDKQLETDGISNRVEYQTAAITDYGFELDKSNPNDLKQFINAIDSLLQLKLTGSHTITLYNQMLELAFNDNCELMSIKII